MFAFSEASVVSSRDCAHRLPGRARRLQRGRGAPLQRPTPTLVPCEAFDDVFDGGRRRAGRRTASCRSRTRSAAASTATTTCCSSTTCRSSGEVELPVVHHLLALPGHDARAGARASTRTRRRWRSASGSCATLPGVEVDRDLRHGRQRQADQGASSSTRRRRRSPRRAPAEVFGLDVARSPASRTIDDNITRFLAHRPRGRPGRAGRQDDASSSRCTTSRARSSRR